MSNVIQKGSMVMALQNITTTDGKHHIQMGHFYKVERIVDGDLWEDDWLVIADECFSSGLFMLADLIKHPAQEKLDQLKKYFLSGNDIPVDRASIRAYDFWKIYDEDSR